MATSDGLNRMNRLLEVLGNPEKEFKAFHIAGTNGKGSTAVMIASVLESAGYSVGLYTSPHLEEIYERIQLWNGKHNLIQFEDYDRLSLLVDSAAEKIHDEINPDTGDINGDLHYFERITAIAYLYYSEVKPDYIVLECGLGGRLDSTNTLDRPLVSIFTQIGLDHTNVLGNTIYKVIREKAGIIKPGVPVVSQSADTTTQQILAKVAEENNCVFTDVSYLTPEFKKYKIGMKGDYQFNNAATAITAIKVAGIDIDEDDIEKGLEQSFNPGRFEVIDGQPLWILDGGHNPDALKVALETFSSYKRTNKFHKSLIIFGCMRDKNYVRMLQLLNRYANTSDFATVDIGYDRQQSPMDLAERIANMGHECICYDSVQEAYETVKEQDYDCVLIIGSMYLVGAMRKLIK